MWFYSLVIASSRWELNSLTWIAHLQKQYTCIQTTITNVYLLKNPWMLTCMLVTHYVCPLKINKYWTQNTTKNFWNWNGMHTQKVYCFLKAKCFPATAELPKHGFHNVFFLKNVILRTFITCNRLYTTGRCLIG